MTMLLSKERRPENYYNMSLIAIQPVKVFNYSAKVTIPLSPIVTVRHCFQYREELGQHPHREHYTTFSQSLSLLMVAQIFEILSVFSSSRGARWPDHSPPAATSPHD